MCYSRDTFDKKIFLFFYTGLSWSLISYGSSFAICKTCFLHISTILSVQDKKALQYCKMTVLRTMIMPRFTRFSLNRSQKLSFCHIPVLNPKHTLRDFEILGWCPAWSVLPHGEKVPLYPWLATLLVMVSR